MIAATSPKNTKDKKEMISATASSKIWRLLRTNTTAVYLHVLVIKTDSNEGKEGSSLAEGKETLETTFSSAAERSSGTFLIED